MSSLISLNYWVILCTGCFYNNNSIAFTYWEQCKTSPSPGLSHTVLYRWQCPDQVGAVQDHFGFVCLAKRDFDMLLAESQTTSLATTWVGHWYVTSVIRWMFNFGAKISKTVLLFGSSTAQDPEWFLQWPILYAEWKPPNLVGHRLEKASDSWFQL